MAIKIRTKLNSSFAFWPFIFVGERQDNEYTAIHENTHIKQQKAMPGIWSIRYGLDKGFRWREERESYGNEIRLKAMRRIAIDWDNLLATLQSYKMASDGELRMSILIWKAQYNAITGLLAGNRK